jgi:4-amino-4-deoxy-L-arabinose transferase-like glycosyltransferase
MYSLPTISRQAEHTQVGRNDSTRRFCLCLVVVLASIGGAMRLRQYLSFPAFWDNEVAVLMNTRHYPASQLPFIHLAINGEDSPVAAPPVFLLITKWMGDYFNYSEWSVRLLPLICSLLAMGFFAHLAWRLLDASAAVWAVALMAFSDPLIFQACNVKPYSGDVLVAVLIAWVAFAARPNASASKRLACAAILTAVAVSLSYSAVFVLAAVGLSLFGKLHKNRWHALWLLFICVLPAVASFAAVYFLSIRKQRDPNLDFHWLNLFPDWRRPLSLPRFFVNETWELFRYIFYPFGPILLAAVFLGVRALRRQGDWQLMVLLVAPWAIDLAAASVFAYPYGGTRLLLYLVPFISLLCGIGAASAASQFRRAGIWAQWVLAAVPVTAAAVAIGGLFVPQNYGDLRDALLFLDAHRKPGEVVYLMNDQTIGAAEWYWPRPDALVHSQVHESRPIHGDHFWLVICFKTRRYGEIERDMHQPDAILDKSRSFHTNGADVLWFSPG